MAVFVFALVAVSLAPTTLAKLTREMSSVDVYENDFLPSSSTTTSIVLQKAAMYANRRTVPLTPFSLMCACTVGSK